ncbi:hypothetical protein [Candidatus Xianfuyuplasma coldseepsis]|uniref:Uncharacterized protein n=1 Tax=Candidatus Xianfuyuplasma coldseepsis TaxID=2782163 RepID=A0A7L7KS40_9MOLU|nr:hypothetical protein [Xianfuyuplasma coldseepsis]QMS85640.1 hypothetical protein G4Z02_07755 [Xianfuyuplasma coldseepsis]
MDTVKEVKGLYRIVDLVKLRRTEGVLFDKIPEEFLQNLGGIDRVIHRSNAISPGQVEGVDRPWYMHTDQSDNLVVLDGERHIDLYSPQHGKIEHFVVTKDHIWHNGELICDYPAVLTWPPHVFHRVESKEQGSASINFAQRSKTFDIKHNFNIYDVNTNTGEYRVIREGFKDQF